MEAATLGKWLAIGVVLVITPISETHSVPLKNLWEETPLSVAQLLTSVKYLDTATPFFFFFDSVLSLETFPPS